MTERARYTISAKSGATGRPFLVFEPIEEEVRALRGTLIALDLVTGTTADQAEELARLMRHRVHGIALTKSEGR